MSALEQAIPEGYKQTDIGIFPDDWSTKYLGDICNLINGRGFKPFEWNREGLPIIRIQNLNGSDEYNYYDGHYNPKILIKNGQLLFAWSGSRGTSFGPHIWYGEDALLNYHTWKMEITDEIEPNYFFHALKVLTKTIEDSAHGASALVHTQMGEMKKFIVPIPVSIQEQTAIANALSDVDALLTEQEKMIAKKQAIKTAIMQQLLTGKTRLPQFATYTEGPLEGKNQGQPKHSSGTNVNVGACDDGSQSGGMDSRRKGTKPSELGEIPEDWDVYKLEQLITSTQLGGNYSNSEAETNSPLIKMGNLGRGKIKLDKLEYANETVSARDRLKFDDVLFNTRNTLELVGKVAIWKDELPEAYFNSNIMRFVFDNNLVSSNSYMNAAMNTKRFVTDLAGIATGTTSVAAIYTRDLLQLKLLIPPKEEQTAIATILSDMDNEIQTLEQRLAKTRQIKQGMMQALLTGRTRLPLNAALEQEMEGSYAN